MSLRPPPKLPSVLDDAGSPNQVQSRMPQWHCLRTHYFSSVRNAPHFTLHLTRANFRHPQLTSLSDLSNTNPPPSSKRRASFSGTYSHRPPSSILAHTLNAASVAPEPPSLAAVGNSPLHADGNSARTHIRTAGRCVATCKLHISICRNANENARSQR
jgi:hypothetical protein